MKYALITGAFGGMGKATVKLLVEKGYTVFALDKNAEENFDFEKVTNKNKSENNNFENNNDMFDKNKCNKRVIPIKADLTNENDVILAFEKVKSITDSLDAIIHYAGIYMLDSLIEIDSKNFEKIFKINLFGAFLINKTFQPLLKSGSKIILTTSELAPLDPLPFTGIYAISKSALDKYAYSLKMELQLLGISVSVLRAGAVKTNMLGASTTALEKFVNKTKLYSCNAQRFEKIVNSVEAKSIEPEKLASKTLKILNKKHPKFAYSINRNFLLKLLNILPKRMQFYVIRKILK